MCWSNTFANVELCSRTNEENFKNEKKKYTRFKGNTNEENRPDYGEKSKRVLVASTTALESVLVRFKPISKCQSSYASSVASSD